MVQARCSAFAFTAVSLAGLVNQRLPCCVCVAHGESSHVCRGRFEAAEGVHLGSRRVALQAHPRHRDAIMLEVVPLGGPTNFRSTVTSMGYPRVCGCH